MSILVGNPFFLDAGAGATGYQISRSLRFNSSDSAYLSRTPASAGNRKTFTYSAWIKRSKLDSEYEMVFSARAGSSSQRDQIGFTSDGPQRFYIDLFDSSGNATVNAKTNALFRDPSSWYHFVIAFDTTQSIASNRIKAYVNGTELSFSTSSWPSQNADLNFNSTVVHTIGQGATGTAYGFNGYLADVHFIDGQALTPSSFTEVSATTGQLIPKAYTGTFTGNSFWLKFADNSAATATTLGKDSSGLGNNWTPNNFSVSTSTTVYTNSFSISGTLFPGSSLANAFDGNIATSATVTNAAQNQTLTFAPSPGIAYTSGVEVYLTPTGDVNVTRYSFNGGSDQSFAFGDGWKTVASGSGTLTSLVIKQGAQGNAVGISAIRINGTTILIDNAARQNDSLVDTPTSYGTDTGAGGEVRGNYATLNPLDQRRINLPSNGNLELVSTSGSDRKGFGTINTPASGKWYWEVTVGLSASGLVTVDIMEQNTSSVYIAYYNNGNKNVSGSSSAYGASFANGDVIGVAVNCDNQTVTFYKNNVSQGSISFPSGMNGYVAPVAYTAGNNGDAAYFNFGQRPFAYTAPSGFKALCDTNLPAPVVAKPSTVMDVKLYTGNGSTQTISGLGFNPDFVWIKSRGTSDDHCLVDAVRGTSAYLFSQSTAAEETSTIRVTSFNSDGFSLGSGAKVNRSSDPFVAWTWDAGTSTVTNTQGSITSTVSVRANPSAGFSVVGYSGASGGGSWGHGLGVEPIFIIFKRRNAGQNWFVFHKTSGSWRVFEGLNNTNADSNYSGSMSASSTVVSLPSIAEFTTDPSSNYIAYCWAPVAGYSSFGSYTGNGSTDGPFVFCNFRPRWLMVKRSDSNDGGFAYWTVFDSARNTYNLTNLLLHPNLSNAEYSDSNYAVDFLANGFKVREDGGGFNANGGTFVWAAFAESPFQYARAR